MQTQAQQQRQVPSQQPVPQGQAQHPQQQYYGQQQGVGAASLHANVQQQGGAYPQTPPVPGNWGVQFAQHAAPVNVSPFNQQAAQRQGPVNVHQLGWGVQFMGDQKSMHNKSESLRKFSGQPTDFAAWARHMIDHMAMVHPHWRTTLEWLATSEENLGFNRLASEIVGPYDEAASDLAVKFEQVQVN